MPTSEGPWPSVNGTRTRCIATTPAQALHCDGGCSCLSSSMASGPTCTQGFLVEAVDG